MVLNSPFLMPDPEIFQFDSWERRIGEEWELLSEFLPSWNPGTDIQLRRSCKIDRSAVLESCNLTDSSQLRVSVAWTSNDSKMGGRVGDLLEIVSDHFVVNGSLPGFEIGGTIRIRTTVSAGYGSSHADGAPSQPGAILFEEISTVTLGDDDGKFPVCIVDFSNTEFDNDASWHFFVDSSDLASSFLGVSLLYINSRDVELVRAITTEKPTRIQEFLATELKHQVSQHLLYLALSLKESELQMINEVWPPESVGSVFKSIVADNAIGGQLRSEDLNEFSILRTSIEGVTRRSNQGRRFAQ